LGVSPQRLLFAWDQILEHLTYHYLLIEAMRWQDWDLKVLQNLPLQTRGMLQESGMLMGFLSYLLLALLPNQ
jgi:hypothetical protein